MDCVGVRWRDCKCSLSGGARDEWSRCDDMDGGRGRARDDRHAEREMKRERERKLSETKKEGLKKGGAIER